MFRNGRGTVLLMLLAAVPGRSPSAHAAEAGVPVVEITIRSRTITSGEQVYISVVLRNTTAQPVWVLRPIMAWRGTGGIEVEVKDRLGNCVKSRIPIGDSFGKQSSLDRSKLPDTHILLAPGDFIGFDRSLESIGFDPLVPGTYTVRATFHADPRLTVRKLKKSDYRGGFDVAYGDISSSAVVVEIADSRPGESGPNPSVRQ